MNSSDIAHTFPTKEKLLRLLSRYNLALPFSERRILLFMGDLLLLSLAGLTALWGRTLFQGDFTLDALINEGQAIWILPMAAIWLIVATVNHCYDLNVAHRPRPIIQGLLLTTLVAALLYLLIFFVLGRPVSNASPSLLAERQLLLNPRYSLPRIIPISFLLLSLPLVALWRIGYIRLSTRFPLRRRAIIVGAGKAGPALLQSFQQPLHGY